MFVRLAGFVAFVTPKSSPWREIPAGGFCVGPDLTLDEFALSVHLGGPAWLRSPRTSAGPGA